MATRFLRLPRTYKRLEGSTRIVIPAGDYAEDDSALCGQFQYLLDTDHAELVQLPSPTDTEVKAGKPTPTKAKG